MQQPCVENATTFFDISHTQGLILCFKIQANLIYCQSLKDNGGSTVVYSVI